MEWQGYSCRCENLQDNFFLPICTAASAAGAAGIYIKPRAYAHPKIQNYQMRLKSQAVMSAFDCYEDRVDERRTNKP